VVRKIGPLDPNLTQCLNDEHGCNFLQPDTFPNDDCTSLPSEFNHGTHIAGLASARLADEKERQEIDRRIELMILKVADKNANVLPAAINQAMIYGFNHLAFIVNMSFTGQGDSDTAKNIKEFTNTLFVAAAGNPPSGVGINLDRDDLIQDTGFPAKLTAEAANVISVAAHDGKGQLNCFSNFGPKSVDLAAPGFEVDSTVSGNQPIKALSGTSQATALVTLTAGLLYSQGLTNAAAMKSRIIASTDFNEQLRGKVFSEGTLNISKALDFRRDIVKFGDSEPIVGDILSPQRLSVSGEPRDLAVRGEVYKILFNYPSDQGKRVRVTVLRRGKLMHLFFDSIPGIQFRKADNTVITINSEAASGIIDLIPAESGFGKPLIDPGP